MTAEYDEWKASEAAAYLDMVRRSLLDVRRIQDAIEVQRSILPAGIDYSREKVASSPRKDALESAALDMLDLIDAYCAELSAYVELQRDAKEAVCKLEDERHRSVLTLYYLDGHSWETIGTTTGMDGRKRKGLIPYSVAYCKELRADALPLFWDVMPRGAKTMLPRSD